jgi:hypothetical protein
LGLFQQINLAVAFGKTLYDRPDFSMGYNPTLNKIAPKPSRSTCPSQHGRSAKLPKSQTFQKFAWCIIEKRPGLHPKGWRKRDRTACLPVWVCYTFAILMSAVSTKQARDANGTKAHRIKNRDIDKTIENPSRKSDFPP